MSGICVFSSASAPQYTSRRTRSRVVKKRQFKLRSVYNRIIETTEFSGIRLLSGTYRNVDIQAGVGNANIISMGLGLELARTVGTGKYNTRSWLNGGGQRSGIVMADINNDSILDLVMAPRTNVGSIMLGNGNGTFQAALTISTGAALNVSHVDALVHDFNQDGFTDIAFAAGNDGAVVMYFGNGNGTFQAGISYLTGAETTTLEACDVNNDGVLDIVAASRGEAKINVLLGNGNGTFKAKISSTAVALPTTLTTADFNGDGFVDVISSSWSPTNLYLAFGNGDGTFKEAISMTRSVWVTDILAVDLNLDGAIDIVTADYGEVNGTTVSVALNRGDGSFSDPISFTTITTSYVLAAGDINNDGYSDIVVGGTSSNRVGVMLNDGQGNFSLSTTFSGVCYGIDVGDLNGDGALDIATAANDNYVSLAKTGLSTLMPYLNLLTQDEAQTAIYLLGSQREYVEQELAVVGALQSRLQIIMENLSSQASNYEAAYSRIIDIDVAEEVSKLVRNQILQKSITSILAQANQQSSVVLSLLKQELG